VKSFDSRLVREAISGPNALDFKSIPIYLLIGLPFTIFAEGRAIDDSEDLVLWTLAKALSLVVLLGTWVAARQLWRKYGTGKLKASLLMAMSGLGGLAQGISVSLFCSLFRLENPVGLWSRALVGVLFSVFWLPLIALMTHSQHEYMNFRMKYVNEIQNIERVTLLQSGLAEIISEELNANLESELARNKEMAFQKLDKLLVASAPLSTISKELREIANVNIREHSHRLWSLSHNLVRREGEGVAKPPKFMTLEMFRLTLEASPLNPIVYTLVITSLFAPVVIRNQPNFAGISVVISFILPVLILQWIGYFIASKSARHRIAIAISTILVTAIVPVVSLAATRARFPDQFYGLSSTTDYVVGLLLIAMFFVLTLGKSTVLSHEAVAKSATTELLKSQVLVDYINVELALVSRKWAQFVHGKLQSQLLSIATTLERAHQFGNVELQMRAISDAQMLFSDPIELFDTGDRTLIEEVDFRIGLWASLIGITINANVPRNLSQVTIKQIGTVVEEALSNSVRHGLAENVHISILLPEENTIEIVVEDDGLDDLKHSQGIGSALFDQVSNGNWSLVRVPESVRTRLSVIIPIYS